MSISDFVALFALLIATCSFGLSFIVWRKQSYLVHEQRKTDLIQKALSISIEINCQNERTNAVLNRWQIKKHPINDNHIEHIKNSEEFLDEKEGELRNLPHELQSHSYTDKRLIEIDRTLNYYQQLLKGHEDALCKVEASSFLKI
jgi:hypothetical protein